MAVQSVILGRFLGIDVETGGTDLAGFQSGQEGVFVDVGAAGGVDDVDTVLHLGDVLGIDQSAAVNCRSMDADEIGSGKDLIHINILDAQLFFDARDMIDIEGDDSHADSLGHDAELLADTAETDDAEGLALQFDALAVGFLFPFIFTHGGAGSGNEAGAGEHMAQSQLSNRLRRSLRCVSDGDAAGFGILDIDVVNTDTASDDEFQLAFLGFINMVSADFCLGTNDDSVKFLQRSTQLIRFVELFDDFVAGSCQGRHGGFIHTICNKNTHNKPPYRIKL